MANWILTVGRVVSNQIKTLTLPAAIKERHDSNWPKTLLIEPSKFNKVTFPLLPYHINCKRREEENEFAFGIKRQSC